MATLGKFLNFLLPTLLAPTLALAAPHSLDRPPGQALDWNEVKSIALGQSLKLESANLNWQSSRAGLRESFSGYLPTLTLSARRERTVSESFGLESSTKKRAYSADAKWNLFNGFATTAGVGRARALEQEALAARDSTSVALRAELRKAFYSVYVSQERIRLFQKTLKRQQQNEKLIGLKYESGTEARWNMEKTRADRERAEFNLSAAEADLAVARENLARLLNVESLPAGEVAIPALPEPGSIKAGIDGIHPDLTAKRETENRLSRERWISRSAFLPKLDLNYAKSRDQNELGSRARVNSTSWSIVASWNVFNGLSDFHKVQQSNLNFEAAQAETAALEREINTNLNTSFTTYRSSLARLPSARSLRAASEERVKTVSSQYRSGLKSYLDWEQAEAQLLEAETNEINALKSALDAQADFERAAGITLDKP